MPPMEFIQRAGILDRNLLLFRDPHNRFYHGKVCEEFPDIETTIAWQRNYLMAQTDIEKVICTGTSAGAYASILFGHYLKVDEVHAFGAVTSVFDSHWQDPEKTMELPTEHQNLALLLENWNEKTKYHIYFAKDFFPDLLQAKNVEGLGGVTLHPLPGHSHSVFDSPEAKAILPDIFSPARGKAH